MKDSFKELYDSFIEETNNNEKLLINYTGEHITSLGATAFLFSTCIIDDLDMVEQMKKQDVDHRYSDAIIRGICDQVIEFIYLYKNPSLLSEYYGTDRTEEELEQIVNDDDIFTSIRKISGDKRYSKRRNIRDMAVSIGEEKGTGDALALYEIFQYYSVLFHSAYRENMMDIIGEVEKETEAETEEAETEEAEAEEVETEENADLDYLMMTVILTRFFETYTKIVSAVKAEIGSI